VRLDQQLFSLTIAYKEQQCGMYFTAALHFIDNQYLPAILHSICLRGRVLIKWRIMP